MAAARPLQVLLVSLGSTRGLELADEQLAGALSRAGANVQLARASAPAAVRTMMLTDLAWSRAARRAAERGLAQVAPGGPVAIIYSTITAALLWRGPGAIRFDALAAGNRPGRHGLWQRPLEQRRLRQAPLLLPASAGALAEGQVPPGAPTLVLPVAVEPSQAPAQVAGGRDIAAVTYAGNPSKKGLDRVLAAWRLARARLAAGAASQAGELVIAGASARELAAAGIDPAREQDVRSVGRLEASEYRRLLRRSKVFVCAPRREDYGAAQLEALADGCLLVTTPAPGPYAALPIARALDARLVSDDLAGALAVALLHEDPGGYRGRALAALAPYRQAAVDELVATRLLPALAAFAREL
jgi:Glycosyl transferases group 1